MTRYYVYDGESYDASYTTPEEARKAAIRALDGWRDDAGANDGWADEAAPVAWGEVREIATIIEHAGAVEEDGLDDRGVDYELRAPDDDLTHAALSTPEGYVGAVSEAVAEELERVRADFAALHIEHEAVRKERDDDRDYIDDIAKRLDALWDLLCSNDSALPKDIMVEAEPGSHLIDEAARLLQMVARERDELRAALSLIRSGAGPHDDWSDEVREGWRRADTALAGAKS